MAKLKQYQQEMLDWYTKKIRPRLLKRFYLQREAEQLKKQSEERQSEECKIIISSEYSDGKVEAREWKDR
jgi:hypothetical protein